MRFKLVLLKDRFILDGVAVTQEVISNWFHNKRTGCMLLKLDLTKASDMLDWEFFLEVSTAEGFGCKWIP